MVRSIFNQVKKSPDLNALWPAIKDQEPTGEQQTPTFYAVRNAVNLKNKSNL